MKTLKKTPTLVFFSIPSPFSSEAYISNDLTATCEIQARQNAQKKLQTNVNWSQISFINTFPYIPEAATGNGKVSYFGD